MVIGYDRSPNLTTDEKIDSLIQNLMLALSGVETKLQEQEKQIEQLTRKINSLGA